MTWLITWARAWWQSLMVPPFDNEDVYEGEE